MKRTVLKLCDEVIKDDVGETFSDGLECNLDNGLIEIDRFIKGDTLTISYDKLNEHSLAKEKLFSGEDLTHEEISQIVFCSEIIDTAYDIANITNLSIGIQMIVEVERESDGNKFPFFVLKERCFSNHTDKYLTIKPISSWERVKQTISFETLRVNVDSIPTERIGFRTD